MNPEVLKAFREVKEAIANAQKITSAAALAERSAKRRASVTAKPKAADGQDSWQPSGPGDFRKAGGAQMNAEETGLVSCYRADMARFEKLPVGEAKLEIGKRLNITERRLAAKDITISPPMDFASFNLEQLNMAIRELEAEIKVLNEAKLLGQKSWFYPFFRQAELDALIERWSRAIAARKTWEQWGAASDNRASVSDSPEKSAMRERAEKIADELRQLNYKLENQQALTGSELTRRAELLIQHGKLNSALQR